MLGKMLICCMSLCMAAPAVGALEIGTNFWDVGWGGSGNDPFLDGYKNVTTANPWKPELLDEIRMYTVFRFMDWGKTNNAAKEHPGTRWADRVRQSDPVQRPVAYEWMIDLCNRTQRDMWVCVPHFADSEYMHELARLIHDRLDRDLRCYVEWSNETWNGMFQQSRYCNEQGKKLQLPPGTKWEDNVWYRGQMVHARQTFETFHQFERTFADQRHRLVTVIGGATAHAFAETHIWAIGSDVLNPHKVRPQAYALAPYFGNGLDGSDPDIVSQCRQAIAGRLVRVHRIAEVVKEAGLELLTYEAGQHLKNNSDVFCANPVVYDVYLHYLAELEPHFALFMQYTHNGSHSSRNSWGAKEFIGQPRDVAHKYRALYDYAVKTGQYDPKDKTVRRIGTGSLGGK